MQSPGAALDVVVRDGCVHWHAHATCEVRDAREGPVAYRCSLRDAWASRLVPCPECAVVLAAQARSWWGQRSDVERARLPLPPLVDLRTGVTLVPSSPAVHGVARGPVSPPVRPPFDDALARGR